jgi:tetratricopeptide (TPR) repeat protein
MFWPGKKSQNRRRKKGVTHWIVMGASMCTILSSVLVFLQYVYPVLRNRRAAPTQWVSTEGPALADETLILVAEYEGLGTLRFDVNDRIAETLKKECGRFPGIRVESCPMTLPLEGTARAYDLGWQYDAWMLFWGRYDDAGVYSQFALPQTLDRASPDSTDPLLALQSRIAGEIGLVDRSGNAVPFADFPMLGVGLQEYVRDILPRQSVTLASIVIGLRCFHSGDTLNARRALDLALQTAGSSSLSIGLTAAYSARGRIRLAGGDLAGAEADLSAALLVDRRNATARTARAWTRFLKGDPAGAGEDGRLAIEAMEKGEPFPPPDPGDGAFARRIAGLCELRSGREASGMTLLEQGLASRDSADRRLVMEGYAALADAYAKRQRFGQEEQACLAAAEVDSGAAWVQFRLGVLAAARRDTASACRRLTRALEAKPDTASQSAIRERLAAFRCPQ